MHVKASLSAILFCLITTPMTATTQEIAIKKPAAKTGTGGVCLMYEKGNGASDCGVRNLKDMSHSGTEENASGSKNFVPHNDEGRGCDKPGDVFEQGVCLD